MYPIHINLHGQEVVIAGGGLVALRKMTDLLKAGAQITIVSPEAVAEIQELHEQKKLRWLPKLIDKRDYEEAFLIVAATNNPVVNAEIASQALKKRQLVNVADQPDKGNFIIPSTVSRGKLIFSVSTGGASPQLSKKIKKELQNTYTEDYESYVDFLHECRVLIKETYTGKEKTKALEELTDERYFSSISSRESFKQKIK